MKNCQNRIRLRNNKLENLLREIMTKSTDKTLFEKLGFPLEELFIFLNTFLLDKQ